MAPMASPSTAKAACTPAPTAASKSSARRGSTSARSGSCGAQKENALRKPANLAFAGRDKKTLYVFGAGGSAFKIQMLAQGFMGRAK